MTRSLLRQPAARRLLFIALVSELGYASLNLSTMPVYLRDSRGFGEAAVGIVLGAFLATEALAKLFTGRWADKFGTHRLIALAPLLSVLSILLTIIAPRGNGAAWETVILASLRVMDGLGAAMIWPSLYAAIGGATNEKDRAAGLSAMNATYLVGIAVAFPLAGFANDLFRSPSAALYVSLALFSTAAVIGYRTADAPHLTSEPTDLAPSPSLTLMAAGFFAFAGISFPTFTAKLFPMDEFRLSESQVGLLVLPTAILLAVLAGSAAKVSARFGNLRATLFGLALCVVGTGAMGSAAFLPNLRNLGLVTVAAPVIGIGFLIALPAWYGLVGGESHSASRLSRIMAAQGLGGLFGAPLGAAMYEKLRPYGVSVGLGPNFAHWLPYLAASLCLLLATTMIRLSRFA